MGQYIKDLSFENPMAPNLPSPDKNPTINLDVSTLIQNPYTEIGKHYQAN